MFRLILVCCAFYLVSLTPITSAMTAEQRAMVREHFEKVGMECLKSHPVTPDDINALRSRKLPTGEKAPCFLACVFKEIGIFDDKGMLQKENALDLAKKVFQDEEELKLIADYIHSCNGINSEAVSDGDKGCDRAVLAYKCMAENSAQFGFDL